MINILVFGKRIKELRNNYGYTQKYVAMKTGLSISTIQKIESGDTNVTLETVEALSQVFKYDLFRVISNCRTVDDFLSEKLVDRLATIFSCQQVEKINGLLLCFENELIQELDSTYSSDIRMLVNSLRDIRDDHLKFKEMKVSTLEKLLFALSRSNHQYLSDPKLYPLELFIATYIATAYRMNREFDKALKTIEKSRNYLLKQEHLTPREHNFVGSLTLTLCYTYHRMGHHRKVIEEGLAVLSNDKIQLSRYIITHIQFRIGVSHLRLGEKDKAIEILKYTIFMKEGKEKKYYSVH